MGMKAVVVTTITTTLDLDTFDKEVDVEVDDQSGLSEVSEEVLYSVVLAGLNTTQNSIYDRSPRLARLNKAEEEG